MKTTKAHCHGIEHFLSFEYNWREFLRCPFRTSRLRIPSACIQRSCRWRMCRSFTDMANERYHRSIYCLTPYPARPHESDQGRIELRPNYAARKELLEAMLHVLSAARFLRNFGRYQSLCAFARKAGSRDWVTQVPAARS